MERHVCCSFFRCERPGVVVWFPNRPVPSSTLQPPTLSMGQGVSNPEQIPVMTPARFLSGLAIGSLSCFIYFLKPGEYKTIAQPARSLTATSVPSSTVQPPTLSMGQVSNLEQIPVMTPARELLRGH
ncbi:uncharacterized protein LOC107644354 isoform X2 [Arachis ipaensis]|uniref:uncharacterized protein LOC107644354 isoform X2 n=1 Tax=Arachis ipaensis TaxID=130454 RepID=UPI000A2B8FDD|nr:uncharacterized protein LOC107644354 isoform X2 [Arachis ipaensis]